MLEHTGKTAFPLRFAPFKGCKERVQRQGVCGIVQNTFIPQRRRKDAPVARLGGVNAKIPYFYPRKLGIMPAKEFFAEICEPLAQFGGAALGVFRRSAQRLRRSRLVFK